MLHLLVKTNIKQLTKKKKTEQKQKSTKTIKLKLKHNTLGILFVVPEAFIFTFIHHFIQTETICDGTFS